MNFRKTFLLLTALVALAGLVSVQAQPLSCVANAGVPPLARAEGVAEEVGQVYIDCQGGSPTAAGTAIPTVNIQIFLNTNLTSRLINTTTNASEATLLIDNPAPASQVLATATPPYLNSPAVTGSGTGAYSGPNVFLAQQQGSNSVVWLNIPFDPPGTTRHRYLSIANVRGDATIFASQSGFIPANIQMFISISGTGSLALSNPQLTVAAVQQGMTFKATNAGTYNQCEVGPYKFDLVFSEKFGTAFRHQRSVGNQDAPGIIYNTESMFYGPVFGAITGNQPGLATQGTMLIARFVNVPSGVTITVGTPAGADTAQLRPSASGSTTASDGKVALVGGAGAAVWEITASNPGSIDSVTVPVTVNYGSNPLPGLGTATVSGNYAPTSNVHAASATEAAPRFVDNPQSSTTFTIVSCKTNLLFPFLTNTSGFDSGIVISNTSADPFSTVPQRGPCTLYYYGTTNGTAAAPPSQTSGTVNEGSQLVATLSGGGNLGVAATPGFQGYVIATCNFQYAHGFAFISDLGASRVAEGYLALVMDKQMSKFPRTGASSEVLGF